MTYKIIIVALLALAVGLVLYSKDKNKSDDVKTVAQPVLTTTQAAPTTTQAGLPRLLDLGSVGCVPCQMMKPMLDELAREYQGRLQVEFIDVNEDDSEASKYLKYQIGIIPTQIFYDIGGRELYRHEGYFSKDQIISKWKELGVDLK